MIGYLISSILVGLLLACNSQSREDKFIQEHTKVVKDKNVDLPYCDEHELCKALRNVKVPVSLTFNDTLDGEEMFYPIRITFEVNNKGKASVLDYRPKVDPIEAVIYQLNNILENTQWSGVQNTTRVNFRCNIKNKIITSVTISAEDNFGTQEYCISGLY